MTELVYINFDPVCCLSITSVKYLLTALPVTLACSTCMSFKSSLVVCNLIPCLDRWMATGSHRCQQAYLHSLKNCYFSTSPQTSLRMSVIACFLWRQRFSLCLPPISNHWRIFIEYNRSLAQNEISVIEEHAFAGLQSLLVLFVQRF